MLRKATQMSRKARYPKSITRIGCTLNPKFAHCRRILAVLLGALLVSCMTLPAPAQDSVFLVGTGSTVPLPLFRQWSSEFNKFSHSVRMQYEGLGTAEGIALMAGDSQSLGKADFAAGEVTLSEKERQEKHLVEIPTVLIGIVPIYNLPGAPELKFTGQLLAEIFLGKVKNWKDPQIAKLNPGVTLPSVPIKVVYRPAGKGTNFVLTEFLSKTSPGFRAQIGRTPSPKWPVGESADRSSDMVDKVKANAGSIGYVELQYAISSGLPSGSVQNSAGKFVKASEVSILSACKAVEAPDWNKFTASLTNAPGEKSFPITSFSWVYLRSTSANSRRRTALLEFLRWIYSRGQQIAAQQGYTQLPSDLLPKISGRINSME
jgi:phosphate transport system substrate-binding protein